MKLLIILLCIGLEKYLRIGGLLKRFDWFERYHHLVTRLFKEQASVLNGWLGVAIMMMPVLLFTGGVYWMLADRLYGFVGVILSFFLLLYSLGPDDLYHQLRNALSDNQDKYQKRLLDQVPNEVELKQESALVEAILILANERFFGVIFWFIFLGPIACVAYRLAVLLRQKAEQEQTLKEQSGSGHEFCLLQQILDWVPARISAFFYLLVGQFQPGFKLWWNNLLTGLGQNSRILQQCGLAALGSESSEFKMALDLVENALIVILVCIALLTLGAWIV